MRCLLTYSIHLKQISPLPDDADSTLGVLLVLLREAGGDQSRLLLRAADRRGHRIRLSSSIDSSALHHAKAALLIVSDVLR